MVDQYVQISASVTAARTVLETGKDPIRVIGRAVEYLKNAKDELPATTPPTGTPDHQRYSTAQRMINDLEKEIKGYAKASVADRVSKLYSKADGIRGFVDAETTRSRPARIFSRVTNIRTPKKIGSGIVSAQDYAKESKTYLTSMIQSLDAAGLKGPEETRYQAELETRIANAEAMLTAQQARHDGYIKDVTSGVARQAVGHRPGEKKASRTRLKDLKRRVKVEGLKRDLAALSKRRV
ncbi:MAG: hypothetical protein HY515_02390 [Candidatus Aenigmarchaeota archaeon]|nr:hypothetical protein [Candidatus Aenigmarchaeota archaeon]